MNSYSQCGEDMIVRHFLGSIQRGSYVDIGASDPVQYNNTYHFYEQGWRGLLVEPLPWRCNELEKGRLGDRVIEAAVGHPGIRTLTVFQPDVLASFYPDWDSQAGREKLNVSVVSLANILKNLPSTDFLSLDVEGAEMEALETNDWDSLQCRPKVMVVETKVFRENSRVEAATTSFLKSKGYVVLADTYINTLYCLPEICK